MGYSTRRWLSILAIAAGGQSHCGLTPCRYLHRDRSKQVSGHTLLGGGGLTGENRRGRRVSRRNRLRVGRPDPAAGTEPEPGARDGVAYHPGDRLQAADLDGYRGRRPDADRCAGCTEPTDGPSVHAQFQRRVKDPPNWMRTHRCLESPRLAVEEHFFDVPTRTGLGLGANGERYP